MLYHIKTFKIMHILEIPSFFPPYGGEFCIEQSKALTMTGHDVRILANIQLSIKRNLKEYFFAKTKPQTINIDGIAVIRKEMRGIPRCVHQNVKQWVKDVVCMFDEYIKIYGKPDIIHAHCAKWAGYAAMIIARQYNIPYVITEHLSSAIFDTEFKKDKEAWQVNRLKQAYKNADMVIPVSEELVDNIAYYFGKDYKWTAISNTIDTDFFHFQERQALDNRPFKFCCLANFTYNKGYDILLAAFDQYSEKHLNVELYIAGKDTNSAELIKMSEQYECSNKIHILGILNKEEVRDLLYNCNCLILPTRSEAQGLVLLEAMSTGIPVITTDAVPKNALVDGGSFICPVDDIPAFCQAMCHIHENYNNIDGKKLSEEVIKMASMKAIGNKLDRLFSEIM